MVDMTVRIRLTIQNSRLNIHIPARVVVGDDRKGFATGIRRIELDDHPREYRAGDLVARIAGTHGMEPAGGENIPRRHLAYVLISHDPFHIVVIGARTD